MRPKTNCKPVEEKKKADKRNQPILTTVGVIYAFMAGYSL